MFCIFGIKQITKSISELETVRDITEVAKTLDWEKIIAPNLLANFVSQVRQTLKEQNIDDKYYFVEDSAADTPYKPYDPDDEHPATEIYLETDDGGSKEISKTREVLTQLRTR